MPRLPIGDLFAMVVDYLQTAWASLFSVIRSIIEFITEHIELVLTFLPFWVLIAIVVVIAYLRSEKESQFSAWWVFCSSPV